VLERRSTLLTVAVICLALSGLSCEAPKSPGRPESAHTQDDLRQDFDTAWRATTATYAYFDAKTTSWADIPECGRGRAAVAA
jgi:hypothetical protein